ncbi:reticulon-1 isoform X1 [Daktulosphaira vitifoliae]|uniref:reticulon-1 isoform X1 n=1 Tax=Daktulosphaira vitifoliae TaxID=58002 RepID=UPI0021AA534B|nr:reticulon-1 isoform X1 [Daktulosphaira vitifoliae]
MEDRKLLDLNDDLSELSPKPISSEFPNDIMSEEIKSNYQEDNEDLILVPEKSSSVENIQPLENTFEVIEQEPKSLIYIVEDEKTEHVTKSDENLFNTETASSLLCDTNVSKSVPYVEIPDKADLIFDIESKNNDVPTYKNISKTKTENVQQPESFDSDSIITNISPKETNVKNDICDIKIGPEELFSRIGLDKWFNPEKLPPKVEALVYWRDPVLSGIVFGGSLVILLSFAYMSLISVIAYLAIAVQSGCILLRLYKVALQTVQKTSESHPFQEYLDLDIRLPEEKAEEWGKLAVVHVNAILVELRRLLLAEDLVDSVKFFGILWVLTYIGAWFNGLTLIILGLIALFTLPKVYENNKTQIDQNIELVRGKIAELTNKVRAAIPIGKKSTEEKKKE